MKVWSKQLIGLVILVEACFVSMIPAYSQEATRADTKSEKLRDKMQKSRGPTEITSDELEIDNVKKIAIYTGNVVVTQDQTNIFTSKLTVYADDTGKRLEKAIAVGDCRLVRERITATGNICTFYDTEQRLEIEGGARAWQEENTLTGARLIAYLDRDVIEAYGDSKPERAVMTLYPKEESKSSPVEKVSNEKQGLLTKGFTDNVPIVITSDKIVLDNPNRTVTYTGNVIAIKGITELKAEKMIAYAQAEKDELLKIEVFDNVHITKETMLFTGDRGVYYDDTQTAILEGVNGNKARAEDREKKSSLEAPVIQAFLATDKFIAKGSATTSTSGKSQRIKSRFEGDEIPETSSEPEQKSEGKKPESGEESSIKAILYPSEGTSQ